MKKMPKTLKGALNPKKFITHAGIAAVAGSMVGILAAILHGAF
jgi:hypothetical protein